MFFGDVRNALVVTYVDDSLDGEEFLTVDNFYESVDLLYP